MVEKPYIPHQSTVPLVHRFFSSKELCRFKSGGLNHLFNPIIRCSGVSKMAFVELNRSFFPLHKDEQPSLDFGRVWGRKLGGWLEWKDLHERQRVVLLAEASSGKS
jgi:hypothetical protein